MAAAACSYLLASRLLQSVKPARPRFAVPAFTVRPFDLDQPEELLLTEQVELMLTDADRLAREVSAAHDEATLAALSGRRKIAAAFEQLCRLSSVRPAERGLMLHDDLD